MSTLCMEAEFWRVHFHCHVTFSSWPTADRDSLPPYIHWDFGSACAEFEF